MRVRRVALLTAMSVVTLNIWTGAPLLGLWVGSRFVGDRSVTMSAVGLVAVIMRTACLELVVLVSELHGLARVEVEPVPVPVAEARGVDRLALAPAGRQPLRLLARDLQAAAVVVAHAGEIELLGHAGAQPGPEALPLHGEHAVAL